MENVKNYLLNNLEVLEDVVREINGYNGMLEDLVFYNNDEEDLNMVFNGSILEAISSVSRGYYNYYDEFFKFDIMGEISTYTQEEKEVELVESIEEILETLLKLEKHICIYDEELLKLINTIN